MSTRNDRLLPLALHHRHESMNFGARITAEEEARRMEVYKLQLPDRDSAERLGISGQAYQYWRASRKLPPWRAMRSGFPARPDRPEPVLLEIGVTDEDFYSHYVPYPRPPKPQARKPSARSVRRWEQEKNAVRKWRHEHGKEHYHRLRMEAMWRYSFGTLSCECCGWSELGPPNPLQIDHVNGGGSRQYRNGYRGVALFREMLKTFRPEVYRILCRGCNSIIQPNVGHCVFHQSEVQRK